MKGAEAVESGQGTAYLSNDGTYTIFQFSDEKLRFMGPYSLLRYEAVREWDDGYIVVMARFSHSEEPVEDYIDLRPILENLYIEPDDFLKPIEKVEVFCG